VSAQRTRAELVISLGVLMLGGFATYVAYQLPEAGGYARIGPNVIPKVVAGSLILLGIWLLAEYFSGGWRSPVPEDPAERGRACLRAACLRLGERGPRGPDAADPASGFVIAGTALFVLVARGFGSTRLLRDAAIGLALTLLVFLFFVKFLNVGLPPGWLRPLLGGAGL